MLRAFLVLSRFIHRSRHFVKYRSFSLKKSLQEHNMDGMEILFFLEGRRLLRSSTRIKKAFRRLYHWNVKVVIASCTVLGRPCCPYHLLCLACTIGTLNLYALRNEFFFKFDDHQQKVLSLVLYYSLLMMAATVFLSPITTLAKHSPASFLHTRHYPDSDPPIYQVGSYNMMLNVDGAIDTYYQVCVDKSNLHNPRCKAEHGKGGMVTSITVWELWMHVVKDECQHVDQLYLSHKSYILHWPSPFLHSPVSNGTLVQNALSYDTTHFSRSFFGTHGMDVYSRCEQFQSVFQFSRISMPAQWGLPVRNSIVMMSRYLMSQHLVNDMSWTSKVLKMRRRRRIGWQKYQHPGTE
ncbi:predicted protein [Lichtheimia corymbifera JMRC:FSU:9682]|uniref:Uncharacterized protein n=1 Tax=Lichtheimia corymbifera JMRC:FSU:9682 TaxID=1263082 RepID=A0A068SBL6_9FUNG|nr:predicted protein [Lichtheimia corymbifera JMRC:FSU:9682]